MSKPLKFVSTIAAWFFLLILLNACGESSPTVAATPTTITTTTAATTLTTVATTTIAATTATTTTVVTATPAATTAVTTVANTATTQAPTDTPTVAGPTYPPTITVGPTPKPSALTTDWVKDGVCYEVFVRSFYDSNGDGKGDLKGLIAKLDYLNDGNPNSTKSLGVNCIWLMPITASPSYHGYDTTDYYKVNPDYGTDADFKTLIQEAHKRGIYVITDLVMNHTSSQISWFQQAASNPKSPYRDWYIFNPGDPGYIGPFGEDVWFKNPLGNDYYYGIFGSDLPDLNYRNPAVTKQMYDVTRYWLQDMGVDGFRLDAVKHLIEDGQKQQDTPETHAWLRDFRKYYTSIKPNAFTIGEVNGPSTELLGYYPDQLDEYFDFSLAESFVNSAKNNQASFVANVQDENSQWPYQRYGTFLTNHDQDRVASDLEGDTDKLKMAAASYLTMPGLPFIYYGEEIGMQGSGDDTLKRTPMQWTSDINGGFTTGTAWEPLNSDVQKINVQAENADPNSLLNLYRNLVHLRRDHPALANGNMLPVDSSEFTTAAYLRQSGNENILVILNMSDQPVTDLKLSLDKTNLAAGQYNAKILLNINNNGGTIAPITIDASGAFKDYAPINNIPAHSGYLILLSK